jgi:hypothetical protein
MKHGPVSRAPRTPIRCAAPGGRANKGDKHEAKGRFGLKYRALTPGALTDFRLQAGL